jgi:5-methylcytosine-specific restriction protein A
MPGHPHQDLYGTMRWRRLAQHQLRVSPWCEMCKAEGKVELATIADHKVPHHGDVNAFWLGELQSLCKPHHDSRKRLIEREGYSNAVDEDGWPLDPRHPSYRKRRA